jgi:predicted nucleotidyltransferase
MCTGSQVHDDALRREINSLLVGKSGGEELSEEPRIPLLHDFLTERLAFYKEYAKQLPPITLLDTAALNALFRETLTEVWNVKI